MSEPSRKTAVSYAAQLLVCVPLALSILVGWWIGIHKARNDLWAWCLWLVISLTLWLVSNWKIIAAIAIGVYAVREFIMARAEELKRRAARDARLDTLERRLLEIERKLL